MKTFFTTSEAAKYLGLTSSSTIQKKIAAGEISAFRAGGGRDWRITRESLLDYMQVHSIPIPKTLSDPDPRVLIVDDDSIVTEPLAEFLQLQNYNVLVAPSGLEAGYLLNSFKPHVVLLDMLLGDMDGRDFIKLAKADPNHCNVVIIGMSAYLKRDDLSEKDSQSMNAFLPKPFKYETMLKRLERAIAKLGQKQITI